MGAVLSLVLVMVGCGRSAPEISVEQVEAWRVLGEEMIPAAMEIEIDAEQVTTMGGNSNDVIIRVSFTEFADLRDSDHAVENLKVAVKEQAPRAGVRAVSVHAGAGDFESEVSLRLLDTVPGIENAVVNSRIQNYAEMDFPELRFTAYIYVKDPEVIDPEWLDVVSDNAQQVASKEGGQIYSVVVLPADAVDLDVYGSEIDQMMIPVQDLSAFADLGADSGCVRTDSWAYDVSNDWVIVHPLGEPDGACV